MIVRGCTIAPSIHLNLYSSRATTINVPFLRSPAAGRVKRAGLNARTSGNSMVSNKPQKSSREESTMTGEEGLGVVLRIQIVSNIDRSCGGLKKLEIIWIKWRMTRPTTRRLPIWTSCLFADISKIRSFGNFVDGNRRMKLIGDLRSSCCT
jgi:hypothetical protein